MEKGKNYYTIRKSQGSYIDGKKIFQGDLILTDSVLKFNKKSIWITIMFGLIGNAIAKGKTIIEIDLKDIKSVQKGKYRLNKKVIEVTTKDDTLFRFVASGAAKWFEVLEPTLTALKA